MAKPAKVNKKQSDAEPAKKAPKKTASAGAAKVKEGKAKKAEPKGLKARVAAKSQTAKPRTAKGAAAKERRSPAKFLREVRLEMSKVTWPSREELIQSTIVVLIAVLIAGVYIFIFDAIFSRLITAVNGLFT